MRRTVTRMMFPMLLCFILPRVARAADVTARPNVVFILADDLGWRDVGCFGSTYHETPNIDRLAKRGIRLTQAYAASPLCSPTRASILTGLYPARTGITSPVCHLPQIQLEKRLVKGNPPTMRALNADSITRLKPDYTTLAEVLKEAGYSTAHFGKWHLGHNLPQNNDDCYEPKDQGFDFDFPHTPSASGPGAGYLAPWKFIKDPAITGRPGEHIEDRMSAEAASYIRAHKDQPFYVNYWAYSVHSPWNARKDYIEYFKSKADEKNPQHNPLYAAMVRSLDDGVGRILAAIDEAGIADRTIVVFFSDNGGWASPPKTTDPEGFTNMPTTSNLPLRSGKASLYEGGTREPCIVVAPGRIKTDSTSDALFSSIDWFPTLLNLTGVKMPGGLKPDGMDQSAVFLGSSTRGRHAARPLRGRRRRQDRMAQARQRRRRGCQIGSHYDQARRLAGSDDRRPGAGPDRHPARVPSSADATSRGSRHRVEMRRQDEEVDILIVSRRQRDPSTKQP